MSRWTEERHRRAKNWAGADADALQSRSLGRALLADMQDALTEIERLTAGRNADQAQSVATIEARAKAAVATYLDALRRPGEDLRAWEAVVRAVDASHPMLTDAAPTELDESVSYAWARQALAPVEGAGLHRYEQALDKVASAVREAWAHRGRTTLDGDLTPAEMADVIASAPGHMGPWRTPIAGSVRVGNTRYVPFPDPHTGDRLYRSEPVAREHGGGAPEPADDIAGAEILGDIRGPKAQAYLARSRSTPTPRDANELTPAAEMAVTAGHEDEPAQCGTCAICKGVAARSGPVGWPPVDGEETTG